MQLAARLAFFAFVGFIALIALWITGVNFNGGRMAAYRVEVPGSTDFSAAGGDPVRGKHFTLAVLGCTDCHAADLGGKPFVMGGPGKIWAPNLTPSASGIGTKFSDSNFERAIRHGMAPDHTRLFYMPSLAYAALSDRDLRDVIAYLRTLPPVDRVTPPKEFSFLGHLMLLTHQMPAAFDEIDHTTPHAPFQPPAANAVYGKYLARIGGCYDCHGQNLAGGKLQGPNNPAAANITPAAIGGWSEAQFVTTLRTGRDPTGHVLNPFMPWQSLRGMSDEELAALYAFLKTVPPVKGEQTASL